MLSRVADSIYWMNRYVERAENVARFVDVNLNLLLDCPPSITQQWDPLVTTTGDSKLFDEKYGDARAENVLHFLTFDRDYPNSILSCVSRARENARSVREIISSEMWEQVNAFYLMVQEAASNVAKTNLNETNLQAFYTDVKMASHLFAGVMDATMSHKEGWHFGQVGRLVERADKTARILDVKYYILLPSVNTVGTPLDDLQWVALLRSASAYEMYRKCQRRIHPNRVIEFLVLDREFPRSIHFSIASAERSLHKISGTALDTWRTSSDRALGRLRSELEYLTVEEIVHQGLHEFLDGLQSQLNDVGEAVFNDFFSLQGV